MHLANDVNPKIPYIVGRATIAIAWADGEIQPEEIECIKNMLSDYDEDWMIYFIGDPNEHYVPITFIKKVITR